MSFATKALNAELTSKRSVSRWRQISARIVEARGGQPCKPDLLDSDACLCEPSLILKIKV